MNLCDIIEIKRLLERHDFHFSKSMGQNFLIEDWAPRAIAEASCANSDAGVLEIGPGIGTLTQELAKISAKVVSIELDKRLYSILDETMSPYSNFKLIPGDVMKLSLSEIVNDNFKGLHPILCANLPYNITTPVLTNIVESHCFESLTVLIQKEVAQRICAKPGTSDYGAFSLLMQYYTEPELLFDIPNTCFIPSPKVTSSVIHCKTRTIPPVQVENEDVFWKTVRAGFALRRKTLANSLQTGWNLSKEAIIESIRSCNLPDDIRGERLSLEDYAKLSSVLMHQQ